MTFLVVSSQETKVSDCNRLVQVVNEAAALQPNQVGTTIAEDNRLLMKAANRLDRSALALQALQFKDAKVQSFQSQLTQLYWDTSTASSDVVTAPAGNLQKVSQVNRTLIQTRDRESSLVSAVNQYCHGW